MKEIFNIWLSFFVLLVSGLSCYAQIEGRSTFDSLVNHAKADTLNFEIKSQTVSYLLNLEDSTQIGFNDSVILFLKSDSANFGLNDTLNDELIELNCGFLKQFNLLDTTENKELKTNKLESIKKTVQQINAQYDSLFEKNSTLDIRVYATRIKLGKTELLVNKLLTFYRSTEIDKDSLAQFYSDSLCYFEITQAELATFSQDSSDYLMNYEFEIALKWSIEKFQVSGIYFYEKKIENQLLIETKIQDEDKNLIRNGSFEQMYDCPTGASQLAKAKFWSSPNRGYGYESVLDSADYYYIESTPDLFALCNEYNFYNDSISFNDIQLPPFEGVNFAIIILGNRDLVNNFPFFSNDSCFSREYLQGTLKGQLIEGKKYIFSMRVLLMKTFGCDRITNKLSIYFSSDSLSEYNDLCSYTPQIITNTYFDQNNEWMLFQTEYIANGTENYFSIGVFLPNDKLELIDNPLCEWPYSFQNFRSNFLIDDVRLECADENGCSLVSNGLEISSQKLTIFPNPASQQVTLKFSEPFNKDLTYTISDLQGRQLLQGSIQNQETVLDISSLSKGIYLLNISDANGNKWNKKIIKGE
jgi:hypothetical protein